MGVGLVTRALPFTGTNSLPTVWRHPTLVAHTLHAVETEILRHSEHPAPHL